ncbi:SMI1/KNR4 family protein [Pedobacter sp. AJM]|uniref:SMI1/KNR4 family protein n=1 Tax=Pedobacter TaxID=84567 RepID=UPI001125090D|nr:SMI1/KNR4 family protein [Pedobacter sp. AJM]
MMSDFRFLEQFKVVDVNQYSALDHKLYSENLSDIAISEDKLGFSLPKELKDFYTQIGYGFFGS